MTKNNIANLIEKDVLKYLPRKRYKEIFSEIQERKMQNEWVKTKVGQIEVGTVKAKAILVENKKKIKELNFQLEFISQYIS